MTKKLVVSASLLAKSQVAAFTRKDGTMVQSHDNGRQAAAPKPAAPVARTRNEGNGFHGEAYSHFLRKKHGPENYMDAASEQDHIDAKAHAGKKFSEAAHSLVQAGHFGNHDEARDYLDSTSGRHLHNEVGDGDVSKVGWVAKDVKNKKTVQAHHEGQAAAGKSKQQAQAASRKNPGGYQPPQPGDKGYDEHSKYGVYFRRGDKVKDAHGEQYEVIDHRGAEVQTNRGTLHPTKLSHADAPSAGAKKLAVRASVAKQAATKTGSAAPAKMKNVGTDKWPLHAKSSDALGAKHPDGSTHHVGGFEPPARGKGDHLIHHDGKTFGFSGKTGKNMKTGEDSFEYSAGDTGEHRAWVTRSGHLQND